MPDVCKGIKVRTEKNKIIKARWISIGKNKAKTEERKVSFCYQIKVLFP